MDDTTTERNEAHAPAYYAYQVIKTSAKGKTARWNRIGAFFAHEDGQGGTLMLDALPIDFDGRIVFRAPKGNEAE